MWATTVTSYSLASIASASAAAPADAPPMQVDCGFEHLPPMILIFRGGMGAGDNTLQVGSDAPVQLSVGSSLMTAQHGAQELVFSLRLPATVSIHNPEPLSETLTFYGQCGAPHPVDPPIKLNPEVTEPRVLPDRRTGRGER